MSDSSKPNIEDKPIVWLAEKIHMPPFSSQARVEAGTLLRQLQMGELLSMPHSRPMPSIAKNCHELRVQDKTITWRIIYALEEDAVVILDIFSKKTAQTPLKVIQTCKERLKLYKVGSKATKTYLKPHEEIRQKGQRHEKGKKKKT